MIYAAALGFQSVFSTSKLQLGLQSNFVRVGIHFAEKLLKFFKNIDFLRKY